MVFEITWEITLVGIGSLLAGIGSLLAGIASLRRANKEPPMQKKPEEPLKNAAEEEIVEGEHHEDA